MAEDLPGYSELTTGVYKTVHEFHIRNNKAKPWLTLRLRSRATEARYLPVYCDGDAITGELVLDLEGDEKTKGITLTVRRENHAVLLTIELMSTSYEEVSQRRAKMTSSS